MAELRSSQAGSTCLVFLDWDDTCFPTSWLNSKDLHLGDLARDHFEQKDLELIEKTLFAFLDAFSVDTTLVFLSAGEKQWTRICTSLLSPKLATRIYPLINPTEAELEIRSVGWKGIEMQKVLEGYIRNGRTFASILSIGDSLLERNGVFSLQNLGLSSKLKSIKLVDKPNLEQWRRQLELLISCAQYAISVKTDLDLMLTIKLLHP